MRISGIIWCFLLIGIVSPVLSLSQSEFHKSPTLTYTNPIAGSKSDGELFLEIKAKKYHIESIRMDKYNSRVNGVDTIYSKPYRTDIMKFDSVGNILFDSSLFYVRFSYDSEGRLIEINKLNKKTRFVYDQMGKVISEYSSDDFFDSRTIYYYDNNNLLVKAQTYDFFTQNSSNNHKRDSTVSQTLLFE